MSKFLKSLCTSLCLYSASAAFADASIELEMESTPEFPTSQFVQMPVQEPAPIIIAPVIPEPVKLAPKKVVEKVVEVNVNPFTGKVKGRKVRMRLKPDLDSRIIKELAKSELVTVVGEKGDFWAVQPPADTKAYVFRSFVLDNVVEGNHVNVRLEPSLDAPVIAHMNSGEKIDNPSISPVNPKWLEITPPPQTKFYIAKEYIEYAGGPEVKAQMDRRLATAEQLLDASALLSKAELRKPFEEIDFERIVKGYHTVIHDYTDFPELVEQAKDALASFQEAYLQQRLSHIETQSSHSYAAKKAEEKSNLHLVAEITDKMKLWEPIEEALYLSWSNINDNRNQTEYYEEQRLAAVELSGIVEPYTSHVKNKPGDFIIRGEGLPGAYLYSTRVNLQELIGKQVKLIGTLRPNNNFAFDAYYVLDIE